MKKFMKKAVSAALVTSMVFANTIFVPVSASTIPPLPASPVVTTPTETTTGEFSQTITTAIATATNLMEAASVTGLTMAIVDAETGFTWTQGFGFASTTTNLSVNEHTLFQIGSISKPFTALAVMQLVEQGIIDLDAPLVTYLPEFSIRPNPIVGGNSNNITVRMLMTHTSGLPRDYWRGFYSQGYHYQGHMNNIMSWLATREMDFVEGTMVEYCNINWTLLGILVSRMAGHNNYFEGFVQYTNENIFAPLGMNRSTFEHTSTLTNVAQPYLMMGMPTPLILINPISAGSMLSSAHDMALYMHMILSETDNAILPQETISYMLQSHTSNLTSAQFLSTGLGFLHERGADGFEVVGHSGGVANFISDMIFNPETGLGVFVSSNSTTGAVVVRDIASIVLQAAIMEKTGYVTRSAVAPSPFETSVDPNAVPVQLSYEELLAVYTEFKGIYSFGVLGLWNLELIDGVLAWVGLDVIELTPMSDGTFNSTSGRYTFTHHPHLGTLALLDSDFGMLPGFRIDLDNIIRAPEGFEQWVGVYYFTPSFANDRGGDISRIAIFIDEFGRAMISPTTSAAPIMGIQEHPLVFSGGRWLFLGGLELIFSMDAYGVASIDILGSEFVRAV